MKNLLPILPSYLLEFPLPTLSRQNNFSTSTASEKASNDYNKTSSCSSLPSHDSGCLPSTTTSSPKSTTSSPATSGLVGNFKTLDSNISGIESTNASNENINEQHDKENDPTTIDLTSKSSSSCTSNAVNPNSSFSILVS